MSDSISDIHLKALVVDTDPTVCETLAQTLKGAGYEPEIHLHSKSVLSALATTSYSLAFIEVDLPDINGVDLARTVKRSGQLEELILMGSNGSQERVASALKLGACDYLQKPFDTNELHMLLVRLRERCSLQRRILEAKQHHYNLIQSIPLLVFSLDREFKLLFINQACSQILGYTPEEAMAEPGWLLDRIHPLERDQVRDALNISFTQGAPSSLECRMIHSKGSEVHGIIRSMPQGTDEASQFCDPDGIAVVEGIFVDITDRVFLEKALIQNEKLKTLGVISSEMAHEVRNPLMSIAGFAKRLQKKHPDMPEVGIILRESLRLERLLNRIRDYLKPVEARPVACSLNSVLGECLSMLYPEMNERGIWCKLEQLEDAPQVMADPNYLSQVFINIVRNALHSLERDAAFIITSRENTDNVLVEFKVPSQGEVELNTEHLFMPFDEGGHSYGLPLSYRLVKDMGGMLLYNLDSGFDIFTVSLPKCKDDSCKGRPLGTEGKGKKGKNVFDESSGVMPRHRFDDLFERFCRTAARNEESISLLIIDVDRFEEYSRNHDAGQATRCIRSLAKTFDATLRNPFWLLSQYGAQEFMVMMPDCPAAKAVGEAEKLRHAAEALAVPFGIEADTSDVITVSIGVSTFFPANGWTCEDMLAQTSKALFLAKQNGRNTVYALSEQDSARQSSASVEKQS